MIVDKIENLARYVALNPLFADVVVVYHLVPTSNHNL